MTSEYLLKPKLALSGIYIYPVKSAAGLALETATLERRGLAFDRRWMVVDAHGELLTQRESGALATLTATVTGDALVLGAPGLPPLHTPLSEAEMGPRTEVRVWGDRCEALEVTGAGRWLQEVLGGPYRLVYMPERSRREMSGRPETLLTFADGAPLLLLSEASLVDLNRRLEAPVGMERFRPNLVVRGGAPYAEDGWRALRVGGVSFEVTGPCARCALVTVDQRTGARGKEPLKTLASYRRVGGEVHFGQNLRHLAGGTLRVGDPLEVSA